MKDSPMYRVWLKDVKKLDSSPDVMINAHGEVFSVVNTDKILQWRPGVVMRNTGVKRDNGRYFYELDMVTLNDDDSVLAGFVVMQEGHAVVWFADNDTDWLDDIGVDFAGSYWDALYNESFSDFKNAALSFPIHKYFQNSVDIAEIGIAEGATNG